MVVNPPLPTPQEEPLEKNLRPKNWGEYLGQEKVKANLRVIIEAAKTRAESLEHLLFYGNPGLGKTTLAHVIANEMASPIKTCTGPTLEKTGDLASLLTNLQDGEILFIDECHRLQKSVMEMLYSALEDFKLHLVIGKGPMARTMELDLPRFTLIGATTRIALLPSPLRNRFGAIFQLQFYNQQDMERILKRSAAILKLAIQPEALSLIASRSRFTPRIANRILKRVRDFATVEGAAEINTFTTQKAFDSMEIDEHGLEPADRKILETIISNFTGGPVGIQALAAAIAEEQDTILDMYEPYLLQLGFLERTPRGRIATGLAYKHLGFQQKQTELL
jgi:holliday junction DNA helicase RuvB